VRKVIESGHSGTRLASLDGPLLDCVAPETLLQHERGTGRNPSNAISILCCYNAEKSLELGGYKLFIDLLKVHNHNLFEALAGHRKG